MGMGFISGQMVEGTRVFGRMESSMVRASTFYQTTQSRLVSGRTASESDGLTSTRSMKKEQKKQRTKGKTTGKCPRQTERIRSFCFNKNCGGGELL